MGGIGSGRAPKPKGPRKGRWAPGQSGNPAGSKPHTLSRATFKALVEQRWGQPHEQLLAVTKDPKSTIGDLIVCRILIEAANFGDYTRIAGLLDRVIGKVRLAIEVRPAAKNELRMMDVNGNIKYIASNDIIDVEPDE